MDPSQQDESQMPNTVYDHETDVLMNDNEHNFSVSKPQDMGGSIYYEVQGQDRQGSWEGKRRYNEFFVLNEVLVRRFPGVPLPILPEKKAIGNKDLLFLQDRTFYLQRYLRKLARYEFILESQEFQLFSRPQGQDIQKSLEKLVPMSTMQKFERLANITSIDISNYDVMKKEQYGSKITEFMYFYKVVQPLLTKLKGQTAQMMRTKLNTIQSYQDLYRCAQRYEDMNLQHYTDMNTAELLLTNPDNAMVFQNLNEVANSLQNPYIDIYHWAKGEIFDQEAVNNSVKERNRCEQKIRELEKTKRETQQDLQDVQDGRKTLTTLFKDKSDTGNLANKIESLEREIEAMQKLTDLLTIYLCERVIPSYKKEKLGLYNRILTQIQVIEISNAH